MKYEARGKAVLRGPFGKDQEEEERALPVVGVRGGPMGRSVGEFLKWSASRGAREGAIAPPLWPLPALFGPRATLGRSSKQAAAKRRPA